MSAKVFGKIRKSSLIFGGPRVSLSVSGQTADHYFLCSRVFLVVLRVFGALWDVPGSFGGVWECSGVFRGCSRVVRVDPGVFRACSGRVPGFPDTPKKGYGPVSAIG